MREASPKNTAKKIETWMFKAKGDGVSSCLNIVQNNCTIRLVRLPWIVASLSQWTPQWPFSFGNCLLNLITIAKSISPQSWYLISIVLQGYGNGILNQDFWRKKYQYCEEYSDPSTDRQPNIIDSSKLWRWYFMNSRFFEKSNNK